VAVVHQTPAPLPFICTSFALRLHFRAKRGQPLARSR
jgi:hypothetical protein